MKKIKQYVSANYVNCSNKNCSEIVFRKNVSENYLVCKNGHYTCNVCSGKYHCLLNCDYEFQKLSKKWIHSNCKKCPKCRVPIQKNGGCNHMYCTKCNTQFNCRFA